MLIGVIGSQVLLSGSYASTEAEGPLPFSALDISALVSPPCRLPLFFLFFAAAALAAARFAFGITDGRRIRKLRQVSRDARADHDKLLTDQRMRPGVSDVGGPRCQRNAPATDTSQRDFVSGTLIEPF